LWNTWFITTVHDARFIQDGILPRLARACHLAVMIGFAIVGSAFDKDDLIRPIIKAGCKSAAARFAPERKC
jgi:hypothetical protein